MTDVIRLFEPDDPSSVSMDTVRSAWQVPADWVTVREHAVANRRVTSNVPLLGAHGRAAMARLRSVGITTVPQKWELADNGVMYIVNVYPTALLDATQWLVWR